MFRKWCYSIQLRSTKTFSSHFIASQLMLPAPTPPPLLLLLLFRLSRSTKSRSWEKKFMLPCNKNMAPNCPFMSFGKTPIVAFYDWLVNSDCVTLADNKCLFLKRSWSIILRPRNNAIKRLLSLPPFTALKFRFGPFDDPSPGAFSIKLFCC